MNKSDLIEEVKTSLDSSRDDALRAIDAVIKGIMTGVEKDKNVQLTGFGTFSVTERAARDGVNPQTGEKIRIKASNVVKFKPGTKLKELV